MADENAAPVAATPEIDVDALPQEDFEKLKRGEEIPAKKDAKAKPAKAATEAEADPAETDDEPEGDKPSETVPHAKFHRANERAKAEAKRAEAAEARSNLAIQRMTELLEAQKPKETVAEPQIDLGPDPNEDPVGYLAWDREQKRIAAVQAQQNEKQSVEQRQQQDYWNTAYTAVNDRYKSAREADPEVGNAYEALQKSYAAEFQALGWRGPQLQQKLQETEASFIIYAYQNNLPIEDVVTKLAEARIGWKRNAAGADQGGEEAPRDAAGRFKAAAAEMDKREATKQAAKSLNSTGGSPAVGGKLTPNDIVDMSPEDFEAFKKKFGGPEKSLAVAMGRLQ